MYRPTSNAPAPRRPIVSDQCFETHPDLARVMQAVETGRGVIDRMPGTGVVVVDDDLRVVLLKGELYADYDRGAAIGRHVSDLMPVEVWNTLRPRYVAALAGRSDTFEYGSNGRCWSVHMSAIVDAEAAGAVSGVLVLVEEVTARVHAEERLRSSERLQRSVVEVLSEGIIVMGTAGEIVQANSAAKSILAQELEPGMSAAEWWVALDARHPDGTTLEARSPGRSVVSSGVEVREVPVSVLRGDGARRMLHLNYGLLRDARHETEGIVISFRDVTEQDEARTRLVETDARLRDAHDLASLASWEWNLADNSVTVLSALPGQVGENSMDMGALLDPVPSEDLEQIFRCVDALRARTAETELVRYRYLLQDGVTVHVETHIRAVRDAEGELTAVRGTTQDVSERIRTETELRSAHDHMCAVTDGMAEGMCTLDLDGRAIYANPAAEELLARPAAMIVGESFSDLVGAGPAAWQDGCARSAESVFARGDGSDLPVAYSASPYESPDGFRGTVLLFSDITERLEQRRRVAGDLEDLAWVRRINDAIERDRLVLHAQPIIDLTTGETVQHELLIRMLDDHGATILPGAFLPAAERYGLIREIDRWVIRRAAELSAAGHSVEVNISADSLGDGDFAAAVELDLRDRGADCSKIVMELTETAVLRDERAAGRLIERMRALGCGLALDDFGTGYGGFTYLKRLNVDFLKIDVEFVRDLARNVASQHVVRAIVSLARDFGHQTVAEGVEDAETLLLLRTMGVGFAQGYHIGGPMPVDDLLTARPHSRSRTL